MKFLQFSAAAKALGITEGELKVQVMSRERRPYVYVSNLYARCEEKDALPEWSLERFPDVQWELLERRTSGYGVTVGSTIQPYYVSGWVMLSKESANTIFSLKQTANLHNHYIGIHDSQEGFAHPLEVLGERVWVQTGDDGYEDFQAGMLTAEDVFVPVDEAPDNVDEIDPRKEKSLLRIVRALDVMANLPQRGAATSIQLQLEKLGFSGPNDDTIQKILKEARALLPDKT